MASSISASGDSSKLLTKLGSNELLMAASMWSHTGIKKQMPLPLPATYRCRKGGYVATRRAAYCFFVGTCSTLAFIFVLVVGLFVLVLQPNALSFDLANVHISVLEFNTDSSTPSGLNTKTTFELKAYNSNYRIGIFYRKMRVNAKTMGVTIGTGDLHPFYQDQLNSTSIPVTLSLDGVKVDPETRSAIAKAAKEGNLPVDITVDILANLKIWPWNSRSPFKFRLHVNCDVDLNLGITTGSQIARDNHCNVDGDIAGKHPLSFW